MADILAPHSPLSGWDRKFTQLPQSVHVAEEPFVTMVELWVDPHGPGRVAASKVLGVDLPTTTSTCTEGESATAIRIGPEEFLITMRSQSPAEAERRLRSAVNPYGGAATDVSAQRTTLRLSGAHARDVLAKGSSIDLHPKVFGPGSAVRTQLALADVVMIPLDSTGTDYRILVRSSFARYLAEWLIDAAEEFGVDLR
ncbi:sarcosine oxidase subunit gamma [Rhodococcus sp. C26F]